MRPFWLIALMSGTGASVTTLRSHAILSASERSETAVRREIKKELFFFPVSMKIKSKINAQSKVSLAGVLPDAASTVCIIRLCSGKAKPSGGKKVFSSTFWMQTHYFTETRKKEEQWRNMDDCERSEQFLD